MSTILSIDHLFKAYGPVKAVEDISLTVREGELFAFLGPNGAGKSTTINVVCTLLAKDSGSVAKFSKSKSAIHYTPRIALVAEIHPGVANNPWRGTQPFRYAEYRCTFAI